MRAVLQRVRESCVSVDAAVNARIATGLLALVSFAPPETFPPFLLGPGELRLVRPDR
jgi:hypothetical protein